MADASAFTKLVPGFDFLQGLVKNAGAALPNMGQWIAPTLNPEELEKRIEELRTVQFWLEQNARMLGATIQALEVQRMTLATLKTMNVQMTDLRDALKVPSLVPAAAAEEEGEGEDDEAGDVEEAPAPAKAHAAPHRAATARAAAASPAPAGANAAGAIDPMQWWGALTRQFTDLATTAMKDTATDAAKNLAAGLMKQSVEAASETLKKAVSMPVAAAQKAASVATSAASAAATATRAAASPAAPAAAKAPHPATAARKTSKAPKAAGKHAGTARGSSR